MFNKVSELNAFDTIIIDDTVMNNIKSKLYNANRLMPVFGIITEGVIKHIEYSEGITHYIYFKELGNAKVEIQDYLYHEQNKKLIHCFSGIIDYGIGLDEGEQKTISLMDRITDLKFGYLFMRSDKQEKERTIIAVQATYLGVFGYIHLMQMDREIGKRKIVPTLD
jgi:hypothetical protein